MFNQFTAWQWELAIVASRFRLGLLSDDEIIAFTHKLMDNGFYDDVMLDIIDNDPLYPSLDIKKNFEKMGKIFGLPCVHTEQAKLINSFQRFYPLSQLPENLNFFLALGLDEKLYLFFEDIFSQWHDERIYVDLENIPVVLYQLEDDFFDYLNRFSPPKYLVDTIFELTVTFENWLNRNQSKILEIMHQLFP